MRAWHFTEQSYEPGWSLTDSYIRIEPPSQLCDPSVASDLLNRFLDEWLAADELGLDIMVNEHHTTMSCMSTSCMLHLAVLARQTSKARLLALGIPIAHRPDPFRVAEEIALVDLMSRGRLEVGFVRGVPYEVFSSNLNPASLGQRFWEAHDLIMKALTHRDGPFRWEGEYFQYRAVNVWPRAYQQPHPPIWVPTLTASNSRKVAAHGYVCASFFDGGGAKLTFEAYRQEYRARHGAEPSNDRLAFCGMVCVGRDQAEVDRRAALMKTYLATQRRAPPGSINPPGYRAVEETVKLLQTSQQNQATNSSIKMLDGRPLPRNASTEELAAAGSMFTGTPDQVFEQIKCFYDGVGGFGHLLMMGQAGALGHADTLDNLSLFAKEVYPRLKELH